MKTAFSLVIVFSSVFWHFTLFAGHNEAVDTVNTYINACKAGKPGVMKSIIAGPFLDRRRVLLDSNREYSHFLQDFYAEISVMITSVSISEDGESAEVLVRQESLHDGGYDIMLILRRAESGRWLIFDEAIVH